MILLHLNEAEHLNPLKYGQITLTEVKHKTD